MIIAGENLIDALKIIVVVAVFFVWVVRYENIKKEFEDYKLPKWFRDFVGILKISFSIMLQSNRQDTILIGTFGIILLMSGAVITHIRVKNPKRKMVPAIAMLTICLIILFYTLNFDS
tara:strand:- start:1044 stop:1397 length:354 start_codon:yes stop_codon:yes gene_type:complete